MTCNIKNIHYFFLFSYFHIYFSFSHFPFISHLFGVSLLPKAGPKDIIQSQMWCHRPHALPSPAAASVQWLQPLKVGLSPSRTHTNVIVRCVVSPMRRPVAVQYFPWPSSCTAWGPRHDSYLRYRAKGTSVECEMVYLALDRHFSNIPRTHLLSCENAQSVRSRCNILTRTSLFVIYFDIINGK